MKPIPALACVVCVACVTCIVPRLAAQEAEADATPRLTGIVSAMDGRPLAGADVAILGLGAARTDSLGRFGFRGLPAGTFLVRVQRLGFSPLMQAVTFDGVHPKDVRLRFGEAATMLAPVIVRDSADAFRRPASFDERRRSGQGLYLSESQIAARHAQRVEHLLEQLPGIYVDSSGTAHVDRGRTSILGDNCGTGAQILLDGAVVGDEFSLRGLSPSAIRGIEVYRGVSTTPLELRSGRMTCGTIAIWTK